MIAIVTVSLVLKDLMLGASAADAVWIDCVGRAASRRQVEEQCLPAYQEAQRRESEEAAVQRELERAERAAAALVEQRRRADEETKTRAAEQEREATERLLAERQENPKFMQLAWSTIICRWTTIRADAKREISKERKYAREGGGVVDLERLYGAQRRMRRADEQSERARTELRDWKVAPLSCREKVVLLSLVCLVADEERVELDEDSRSACHSLDMVLLVETIYRADGFLRR